MLYDLKFRTLQNNEVVALDIISEKINLLNEKKSPIVDTEIEDFLKNKALALHSCPNLCS
jgi:UDPglucose 6-dehydrogenase